MSVKPAWQVALFWQGFFAQAFFKERTPTVVTTATSVYDIL